MVVSVQDLRQGIVVKVKPAERARLINRSVATLSRWRHEGVDIPYEVDPRTHRITYSAADVLAELDGRKKFSCTTQYEHNGIELMENARGAKEAKKNANHNPA